MRHIRYSLAGLMGFVFLVALTCGALLYPSQRWVELIFTLSVGVMLFSIMRALFGSGGARRFWGGMAIFGWGYLILTFGPWFEDHVRPHLLTNAAIEFQYRNVQRLGRASADQVAEKKLKESVVTLEFVDTPLSEVVQFLRDYVFLNVVLDRAELAAAGISTDHPVTIDVQQVPFESALRVLLKQVGLAYSIQDGMVIITRPQSAGPSSALLYLQRIGHSLFAMLLGFFGGMLARAAGNREFPRASPVQAGDSG